jgi:siroheme synthase (precorrin-2 oxidase/ferrochelatase)
MLPLSLNLTRLNLVLVGDGDACLRRLQLLNEAGARSLAVFSASPSPGLAAGIKEFIAALIGPEWRGRLDRIAAALRRQWRDIGADHATVRRLTAARIDRYGWLKQYPVAVAANDRGTDVKASTGGGIS